MKSHIASAIVRQLNGIPNLYGIDPGGHTGLVHFSYGVLKESRTIPLKDLYVRCSESPFRGIVVVEEFTVYPWMSNKLMFDRVPAARAIGAVCVAATGATVIFQTAQRAKTIKHEDLRSVFPKVRIGSAHELDALRHVVVYITSQMAGIDATRRRVL